MRLPDAPTISFWGGIGTIGGTKVVIQQAQDRVIIDFGLAYAPGEEYYDARLQPRPDRVLHEYLCLGYAPPIPGLYRRELLSGSRVPPGPDQGPAGTAVFISHLHLDHHALTGLIAPGIPVYMHGASRQMLDALQAVGETTPGAPRSYSAFAWEEPVQVGSLRVTAVPVDHDIPGAAAFFIETAAGTVVYSGDLRLHGARPELVRRFAARARALRPLALLIEGTRLGEEERGPFPPPPAEPELADRAASLLRACGTLALINLYPRNIERIAALQGAAAAAGRTLALEAATAAIYTRCGGSLAGAALYLTGAEQSALEQGRAPAWLAGLVRQAAAAGAPVAGPADVAGARDRWLVQLTYPKLGELVDLAPQPGSICLHSNGEPLGAFDPAYPAYERWLRRFGVAHVPLGSTGHASPRDLHEIAAEIAPQVLVPVHSLRPDRLAVPGIPRLLPEYGATYRLDRLVASR